MLLLLPSEQPVMSKKLTEAKIPIKSIKMNPSKRLPVTPALQVRLYLSIYLDGEEGRRKQACYAPSFPSLPPSLPPFLCPSLSFSIYTNTPSIYSPTGFGE